jgi:hypothetical protein
MKNKDLLGNEVKTGDIMLEIGRGGGWNNGEQYFTLKLWEVPEILDGRGNYYTTNGDKTYFYWANIKRSIKINMNLMPDGFEFSFKHGLTDFSTKIEYGTLQELIENSNWKKYKVTKKQVERYNFIKSLKIESIKDIINHLDELKKPGYIPHEIMTDILNVVGIGRTPIRNGELGIAGMYDYANYIGILEALSKDPNCFENAEVLVEN